MYYRLFKFSGPAQEFLVNFNQETQTTTPICERIRDTVLVIFMEHINHIVALTVRMGKCNLIITALAPRT